MHGAGSIKPGFGIGLRNAERREANTGGLNIGEDERGGRPKDVGAFAELVWPARIHVRGAWWCHVIVHRVTAQFRERGSAPAKNGFFGRTTIDLDGFDVFGEGGFAGIVQVSGVGETGGIAMDGRFDPTKRPVIAAAEI